MSLISVVILTTGKIFSGSLSDFKLTVDLVGSHFTVSAIDKALHIGMLINANLLF